MDDDNNFLNTFTAWPLRIVLISNEGIIEWVARQIAPYNGVLQISLFRAMEKTLQNKLQIKKDAVEQVDDLMEFVSSSSK